MRPKGTNRIAPEAEAELTRRYADGEAIESLCEAFGVHPTTVQTIVRRNGGNVRPTGAPQRRWVEEQVDEMHRLWTTEKWSQTRIAAAFETTQIAVSRALRARGIETHPRPNVAVGERHGSWKGGRTLTGDGKYDKVAVSADDPLATMRDATGYVLEHRLVMARAIGRPLERHETVHHIDGDTHNNRLPNLQLRFGRHGKGVAMQCRNCGSHDIEAVPLRT